MEKDTILFLNLPRARVLKGRISLSGVRSGHTVGETVGAAAVRFTDQKFRSEHSSDFEFAHACGQLFRYIVGRHRGRFRTPAVRSQAHPALRQIADERDTRFASTSAAG